MKLVRLKIVSPNYKLIKSKLMFLQNFCHIYKVKYTQHNNTCINKRYSVLRSPHIHKKTWRNYIIKYYSSQVSILLPSVRLLNLFILLKLLSFNAVFKIKVNEKL